MNAAIKIKLFRLCYSYSCYLEFWNF